MSNQIISGDPIPYRQVGLSRDGYTHQDIRAYVLETKLKDVEAIFGVVPPLFLSQDEMKEWMGDHTSTTPLVTIDESVLTFCGDPATQWFVIPFTYVRTKVKGQHHFYALPSTPTHVLRDGNYQKAVFFMDRAMSRVAPRTPRMADTPKTVHIRVRKERTGVKAWIGESISSRMILDSGTEWVVGAGEGIVQVELTPSLVEKILLLSSIPEWEAEDFTNPETYRGSSYTRIEESHIAMAQNIIESIPEDTFLIVPGDGSGLFSRLWKGPGHFGDRVVTQKSHSRVVQEDIEQTIARPLPSGAKPLVICSYISAFYTGDTGGYPSVWIDYPMILDRVPGLIPVSEAVYARGTDVRPRALFDRAGRRPMGKYHVPYLHNLLNLRAFRLNVPSRAALIAMRSNTCLIGGSEKYRELVVNSGSVWDTYPSPWVVPNLRDLFDETGESVGPAYCVPLGRIVDVVHAVEWRGTTSLSARSLYWIERDYSYLIPPQCLLEEYRGRILFCYPEAQPTVLKFTSRRGANFSFKTVQISPCPPDSDYTSQFNQVVAHLPQNFSIAEFTSKAMEDGSYFAQATVEAALMRRGSPLNSEGVWTFEGLDYMAKTFPDWADWDEDPVEEELTEAIILPLLPATSPQIRRILHQKGFVFTKGMLSKVMDHWEGVLWVRVQDTWTKM